jgi:3-phosphoshikimate 1-carboxyvinyltransferase
MDRVVIPLEEMGARIDAQERAGQLPLRIRGGDLASLVYRTPMASAQVKSAVLLAGLVGGVGVGVIEPRRSRDHTERLFRAVGITVNQGPMSEGWEVQIEDPPETISPLDLRIPGDFSSAAFLLVLGLLRGEGRGLLLTGVGLNETRTGLLQVLERMGASFGIASAGDGEPMGDIETGPSVLRATEVGEAEIPGLIDEIPILAVAASRAEGVTTIRGAGELRVKESDRIAALCHNLRAVGVEAEEVEDGLDIQGSDRPARGAVLSLGDHRIAMAFGVLAALPGNEITIDDTGCTDVSFPGFWEMVRLITGREVRSS